jgi:hypothetical protein
LRVNLCFVEAKKRQKLWEEYAIPMMGPTKFELHREKMFCTSSFIAELKQLDIVRNIYNFEMTAEIILSNHENHLQV